MANFNPLGIPSLAFKCGGAIPINSLVMLDSTTEKQVVVTSGITSPAIGVAMETGATGDTIPVQPLIGIGKCISSTTIACNAEVMVDASGKVTTASGATARSVGIALQAAGAGGADVIEVLFTAPVKGPANA